LALNTKRNSEKHLYNNIKVVLHILIIYHLYQGCVFYCWSAQRKPSNGQTLSDQVVTMDYLFYMYIKTKTFKSYGFLIVWLWAYLMKFIPETRRYLHFYYMSLSHLCRCFYDIMHYTLREVLSHKLISPHPLPPRLIEVSV
jgi:hypothetical protein